MLEPRTNSICLSLVIKTIPFFNQKLITKKKAKRIKNPGQSELKQKKKKAYLLNYLDQINEPNTRTFDSEEKNQPSERNKIWCH